MPLPPPIPVERYLVPAGPTRLPAGFTRVRVQLTRGLPYTLMLDADFSLSVYVPLGNVLSVRDALPGDVVSDSAPERTPRLRVEAPFAAAVAEALGQGPVRLVVQRARQIVAVLPLAVGLRRVLPERDGAGPRVELAVLGWSVRAGTLRGVGEHGSFLEFAWRRAERGAPRFVLPKLQPRVAERFDAIIQSEVGGDGEERAP